MRSENRIFDKRYCKYAVRRITPFFIAANALMLIATAFIYLMQSSYIFLLGEVVDLSDSFIVFLYIYPVLLGIYLFRFLFSKKQSDLVGSFPVKRSTVYFTNMIIGAVALLISCILITAIVGIEMNIVIGNDVYIAPQVYLWTFLFWFVAFFTVFAVTSVAATLSGTYITHLMLTAVFLFSPVIFELIFTINVGIKEFSVCPSAGGIVYLYLIGSTSRMHSVWYLVYSLIFAIVAVFLGLVFFKNRKFETAENGYSSKIVKYVVRFGIYLPATILISEINTGGGFLGLFLLLAICFVICEVLMNKGFRLEMLKGLAVLGCSVVICIVCVFLTGLYTPDEYPTQFDVETITLKVPRCDQISDFGDPLEVEIERGEFFDLFDINNFSSKGGDLSVEIEVNGEYTYYISLSDEEVDVLLSYLAKDEEFLNKFYWKDFPEKAQNTVFSVRGLIMQNIPSNMVSSDCSSENVEADIRSALASTSVRLADKCLTGESGAFGIYFVNNSYYIKNIRTENVDFAAIREKANSSVKLSDGVLCSLYAEENDDADVYFIDRTVSRVDSSVIKRALAESKGNAPVPVKVPGKFNYYSTVFVDASALYNEFAEFYNGLASDIKKSPELFRAQYASGIFEKYYEFQMSAFGLYEKSFSATLIPELAPYFVTWEEVSENDEGLYYYVDGFYDGIEIKFYFERTEEVEAILEKYVYDVKDVIGRFDNAENTVSLTVGDVEITDPEDVAYLSNALFISGEYTVSVSCEECSDSGVYAAGFTEKMRDLLSEKYNITCDEETEIKFVVSHGFVF